MALMYDGFISRLWAAEVLLHGLCPRWQPVCWTPCVFTNLVQVSTIWSSAESSFPEILPTLSPPGKEAVSGTYYALSRQELVDK